MDVSRELEDESKQLVWLLQVVQDYDYRLQEEEIGTSLRETFWRCPTSWMEGCHFLGDHLAIGLCGCLRDRLHVRQVLPRREWEPTPKPTHPDRPRRSRPCRLECHRAHCPLLCVVAPRTRFLQVAEVWVVRRRVRSFLRTHWYRCILRVLRECT